jgi:hypothetical protein
LWCTICRYIANCVLWYILFPELKYCSTIAYLNAHLGNYLFPHRMTCKVTGHARTLNGILLRQLKLFQQLTSVEIRNSCCRLKCFEVDECRREGIRNHTRMHVTVMVKFQSCPVVD